MDTIKADPFAGLPSSYCPRRSPNDRRKMCVNISACTTARRETCIGTTAPFAAALDAKSMNTCSIIDAVFGKRVKVFVAQHDPIEYRQMRTRLPQHTNVASLVEGDYSLVDAEAARAGATGRLSLDQADFCAGFNSQWPTLLARARNGVWAPTTLVRLTVSSLGVKGMTHVEYASHISARFHKDVSTFGWKAKALQLADWDCTWASADVPWSNHNPSAIYYSYDKIINMLFVVRRDETPAGASMMPSLLGLIAESSRWSASSAGLLSHCRNRVGLALLLKPGEPKSSGSQKLLIAPPPRQIKRKASAPIKRQLRSSRTKKVSRLGVIKASHCGKDDVGRRIRVYWPKEKRYYAGVIKRFYASSGEHAVSYNDGDYRRHRLNEHKYIL